MVRASSAVARGIYFLRIRGVEDPRKGEEKLNCSSFSLRLPVCRAVGSRLFGRFWRATLV
uniref:Uncharacterized protein n=1 Tax=Arundo donax TaxID=35708 RepID=A0A0A9GDT0_ARUDO